MLFTRRQIPYVAKISASGDWWFANWLLELQTGVAATKVNNAKQVNLRRAGRTEQPEDDGTFTGCKKNHEGCVLPQVVRDGSSGR
jgi:hypothetical protein